MTNTYKRVSAALLSVLLLCMFTFGASAASSLNVGIKFWKERSDKESMANTGIDASRDVTLTRQSNGTYIAHLAHPAGKQDGCHRLSVRPDHW